MKVYVAGPYGRRAGMDSQECEDNVANAIEAGRRLILLGHTPFIPQMYHYVHTGWKDTPNEDVWLQMCIEWVEDCDAVLRIPGYSEGATFEIARANQLGIPVYYSIEEIPVGFEVTRIVKRLPSKLIRKVQPQITRPK